MRVKFHVLSLVVAFILSSAAADAGPTDTPLPSFSDGKPAISVYNAVGVIKNNNLETAFVCTNLDSVAVDIGVEVFDETGARRNAVDTGNGAFLDVAPGRTVTVATAATAVLHEDTIITLNNAGSGANNLRNGSGRVVATSKSVGCTATVLDELHEIRDPAVFPSAPPPVAVSLPLLRVP